MGKDFNESVDVLFHKVEDLVSTKTVVESARRTGFVSRNASAAQSRYARTMRPLMRISTSSAAALEKSPFI